METEPATPRVTRITPIHPGDLASEEAAGPVEASTRRTFGIKHPSRRTFGKYRGG